MTIKTLITAIIILVFVSPPILAQGKTTLFVSQAFGITLHYPATLEALEEFPSSFFTPGSGWNHRGPKQVPGSALIALKLPDSNAVLHGVLRLGASNAPKALNDCLFSKEEIQTQLPGINTVHQVRLDKVDFQMVTSGGAATGHEISERSYRAVHTNHCIAIDLIVAGSWAVENQQAPFSTDEAFNQLTALLAGLDFTPPTPTQLPHLH